MCRRRRRTSLATGDGTQFGAFVLQASARRWLRTTARAGSLAAHGGIAVARSPIEMVGRPRPTTPFTKPARRNTTPTSALSIMASTVAHRGLPGNVEASKLDFG